MCMWVLLYNIICEIDVEKKIRYCKCFFIVCDYSYYIYIILNCIMCYVCIIYICIDIDCLV